MRIVVTTICALTLAGCASDLPYSIAIGDPRESTGRVGQKDCVLRLDDIAKKVAEDYPSSESTVRSLQIQFEKKLHENTQALEHCIDGNGNPVQPDAYPPIEKASKKWLTSYALDATNPDQGLDRFREYVRSAQIVQYLARQPLLPDENENKDLPLGRATLPESVTVVWSLDKGIPLRHGTIAVPCAGRAHGS